MPAAPGPETPPRFYDLLRTLCEAQVEFVLIGGFAVALQGYVRATKDVDLVPRLTRENYARLWDVLTSIDAQPAELADFAPAEMPMPFSLDGLVEGRGDWIVYPTLGRIDLMPHVEDADGELPYEELRERAAEVSLPEVGHPILVASVDDLIAMKEHAGRDQDRIDATALRMTHGLEDD